MEVIVNHNASGLYVTYMDIHPITGMPGRVLRQPVGRLIGRTRVLTGKGNLTIRNTSIYSYIL